MISWALRMLKGALIGVGAILPGISGGVLSVLLGVYRPLMSFLAHPIRTFKEQSSFLLPVLIGWVLGVLALSRLLGYILEAYPAPATWVFVGLMVGTLPQLWRDAGQQGRPRSAYVALVASACLMGGLLYLLSRGQHVQITPNLPWWLISGVLWGLGIIVPGLSPSSLFLFFGYYEQMMVGIGRLDFAVILPIAISLVATVLLLARGINALLERKHAQMMHAILGIVVASTVAILPLDAPFSWGNTAIYMACFACGACAALLMDLVGRRTALAE